MILRIVLMFLLLSLVSCANSIASRQESDLQLTWSKAIVVLPPERTQGAIITRMDSRSMKARLEAGTISSKFPVIVYLHGCTGIGNVGLMKKLASNGFVVIAPDSFARKWRPLQCDPETQTGGYNLFVYDFRLAEISYTLNQLWQQPWVNQEQLFLLGSSEGAVAAALYRGNEFRGRVIAQWTCSGAPHVKGIAGPLNEPVLALVGAKDPWYLSNRQMHCGMHMENRPNSLSMVVGGSIEGGHDVLIKHEVQDLILEFFMGAKS